MHTSFNFQVIPQQFNTTKQCAKLRLQRSCPLHNLAQKIYIAVLTALLWVWFRGAHDVLSYQFIASSGNGIKDDVYKKVSLKCLFQF